MLKTKIRRKKQSNKIVKYSDSRYEYVSSQ